MLVFVAARAFSSCGERELLFVAVHGLLISGASLVAEPRLWSMGSVVVAHGFRGSLACGIFPGQGSNPCPIHWQVDSYPLYHQGSPRPLFKYKTVSKTELTQINSISIFKEKKMHSSVSFPLVFEDTVKEL